MSCCHEAPSYTARKQEHLDLKQTAGSWIQALQQLLPLAQVTWLAWSNALCGQEVRKRATFSASRERGSSRTQASWCQGSFIPVHSAAALGARLTTSLIKKKKKKKLLLWPRKSELRRHRMKLFQGQGRTWVPKDQAHPKIRSELFRCIRIGLHQILLDLREIRSLWLVVTLEPFHPVSWVQLYSCMYLCDGSSPGVFRNMTQEF